MCAVMYPKIFYQSIFCIVSIHRENSEFSHSLKFHIVVNTQKTDTLKNGHCFTFLNFNAFQNSYFDIFFVHVVCTSL